MRVPAACLALTLAACAGTAPRDDSLYRALGGLEGIDAFTAEFVRRITTDPRVAGFFAEGNRRASLERIHEKFVEQLCMESGGPCGYTGDPMELVHRNLDISAAEFNAVVEILDDAMTATGVPLGARNRLIARLAPMRSDIVR